MMFHHTCGPGAGLSLFEEVLEFERTRKFPPLCNDNRINNTNFLVAAVLAAFRVLT